MSRSVELLEIRPSQIPACPFPAGNTLHSCGTQLITPYKNLRQKGTSRGISLRFAITVQHVPLWHSYTCLRLGKWVDVPSNHWEGVIKPDNCLTWLLVLWLKASKAVIVPIRCAWGNHGAGLASPTFCEQGLIYFLLELRTTKPKQGSEVIRATSQRMSGAKPRREQAPLSSQLSLSLSRHR